MAEFILAFDQGTTSSRAIIFDRNGLPLTVAQKEFTQYYPKPGWVEHDPDEIWSTQAGVAVEAITKAGIEAANIAAIGITNQRETTVVWNRRTGKPVYNAIVWQDRRTADFCDQLKKDGKSPTVLEKTGLIIDAYFSATKIKDSDGVYFVPAFAGLDAPHWQQHARGTLVGITRGTTSAHIARAALDSIAYQTLEVLLAMQNDSGIDIRELRVDGGATVNNQLMQIQSDLLQVNVVRPKITEITALGAAYLAGLAVNYWSDINELKQQWQIDRIFSPKIESEENHSLIKGWHRAVNAAKAWADDAG